MVGTIPRQMDQTNENRESDELNPANGLNKQGKEENRCEKKHIQSDGIDQITSFIIS